MRYILLILLLTACKTSTVQNVTYNIEAPASSYYSQAAATLSDIDSLPDYRVTPTHDIAQVLRSLPQPVQLVSGKGPVVLGDSNQVAGRKVKAVTKEKTRNVENDTGWLIWIGGFVVLAILIYFLVKR